jgi:D-sedoheptulose 7-phosphate isomerase
MKDFIDQRFEDHLDVIRRTRVELADRIQEAAELVIECYRQGGGVFLFGNGGSAADAQHIAAELVGRFLNDRPPLKAQALTTDSSIFTSVSNDYSFQDVFARQLEANATEQDLAIGLTTSGNSANVITALAKAREIGMKTIAFTGHGGGKCTELANVLLDVPSRHTPHVQETHVVIYHMICECVEQSLFQA